MNQSRAIILGSGGHAASLADTLLTSSAYSIAGFVSKATGDNYRGIEVIGSDECLKQLFSDGIEHAFIGVGYLGEGFLRNTLYQMLKEIGFVLPPAIDVSSTVALDVAIGEGTFIGKNAVINARATVGTCAIINTGAIIEHDCVVGDFSHVSVGACLCGGVSVGENAFIGANATIIQGVKVGSNAIIGAGSLILSDVPDDSKVFGVFHAK